MKRKILNSSKHSLIFSFVAIAFTIQSSAQSSSVKQYNHWINQAELAICDSNLTKADSLYTLAFRIQKPLAREIRTAFWVATQTQNSEKILQIAKLRTELGDEEVAGLYQHTTPHFDSTLYNQLLFIEKSTPKTYLTKFDTILENILERHQQAQCQSGQDKLYEENRKIIKQIYREYPDFNEYVAGFYYLQTLQTSLLHAVQTGHYELQTLLRPKVLTGIFPVAEYMNNETNWGEMHPGKKHQYGIGMNNIIYIGNTLFVEQPKDLKQVNKNREKLGLAETWQDAAKKRVWECEHRTYCITGSMQTLRFENDEEDAKVILEMKQAIDAEHAQGDFHRMYYEKGCKVE